MHSDCSISPAHIDPQSHTGSACFLFCHHFTPKLLAISITAFFPDTDRAFYTSNGIKLVELFCKFFPMLAAFHSVLRKHLGISPKAVQGESLGSSAAVWCRMSHAMLTGEEISFWIFGSVEEQMCYTVTHPQCGWYVLNHNPDLNPYSKQKHSRECCCSAISWFCLPLIL